MRLENFKSWQDTSNITLRPITGFFGANSSGKTSLIQALLLLKQTADSPNREIVFHFGDRKTPVDLGDFESVIHGHDTSGTLRISFNWEAKRMLHVPKVGWTDDIGFSVASRKGKGKSPILDEMSYRVGDAVFGMRRKPDAKYDLFADGTSFEFERYVGRPFDVLSTAKCYGFPDRIRRNFWNAGFLSDLEFGLEERLGNVYYLGPLRAHPERRYAWSGAQPIDMGRAGESVVDAILTSRERDEMIGRGSGISRVTLEEYVALWLKELGLVHDFSVVPLAEGSPVFEVRVRKSPKSAEVLITDVGFGVSQILPVLVLCFYVPKGSTVILEQPEIHLHPAIQAGLADVFIDAWKKRGVQILLESHSEHLLRRLQRRIAEEDVSTDDVGLFFCRADDAGSILDTLELDPYGNITNWPKDFFGDQFGEIAAMSEAALKRRRDAE